MVTGGLVLGFTAGLKDVEKIKTYSSGGVTQTDSEWVDEKTTWYYVGSGLAITGGLWSWIDAPLSAQAKNKKIQRQFGHLFELELKGKLVGIDTVADRFCLRPALTLHF